MRMVLVGGAVRDILLGRPVKDKDFIALETDEPGLAATLPRARKVGKSFGVFLVEGTEIALPRGGGGLDHDLALRDLTINAMALDEDGELACHPLALEDLAARVLRPCSAHSLESDPARVFRAARLWAQMPEFSPHPDLEAAMGKACREGRANSLPAERVGREVEKALAAPAPSRFFKLLARTGCLGPWFAELEVCRGVPAGPAPRHGGDVFDHLMDVADALAGDPLAVWMGVAHDLGKAATDPDKWPAHHGHEALGEEAATALGRRLGLPGRFIKAGAMAARLHMKAGRYPELRPGTRVDLLAALDARGLARGMFALARADHGADHWPKASAELGIVRAVSLPEPERGLGEQSGRRLRELRCLALAEAGRGKMTNPEL